MKISGCLIAKNEERCIARCINSMKNIVQEIVVVDTGSTDRTVEIAQSLGARMYYFEWDNDFSHARNFAIEKCKGDWFIFLDADEWFATDEDAEKMRNEIKKYHNTRNVMALGVYLRNILYDDNKNPSTIDSVVLLRAYRNDPRIRFRDSVHEWVDVPKGKKSIYNPEEKIEVLHDGYMKEILQDKATRNLELLIREFEIFEQNQSSDSNKNILLYHIGKSYYQLKQYTEAYDYLLRYVKTGHTNQAYAIDGILLSHTLTIILKKPQSDRDLIVQYALEQYPNHPSVFILKAESEKANKKYIDAIETYEKAFELKKTYRVDIELSSNMLDNMYYTYYANTGSLCEFIGDYKRAAIHFKSALGIRPKGLGAAKHLFIILMRGDQSECVRQINELYPDLTEEYLEFILSTMRTCVPTEAFAVFFDKWFSMRGEYDLNFLVMLQMIGEYVQAWDGYRKRFELSDGAETYAICMTACCVQSGNPELYSKTIDILPDEYTVALRLMTGAINSVEELEAQNEKWTLFHNKTLQYLLSQSGPTPEIIRWAELNMNPEVIFSSAKLLFNLMYFKESLSFMKTAWESNKLCNKSKSECIPKMMQLFLLLGEKANALSWLKLCETLGMVSNEVKTFETLINSI